MSRIKNKFRALVSGGLIPDNMALQSGDDVDAPFRRNQLDEVYDKAQLP